MSSYRGVIQGNTVILEEGVHLPNGTTVVAIAPSIFQEEEMTAEELNERQELVTRLKEFGQKLAGRTVNLGDLILEAKDELDDRA